MKDDIERADRVAQSRARMAPFLGFLVLAAQQVVTFRNGWDSGGIADKIIWVVFAVAALGILLTGGGLFTPKRIRELINDDVTRANRATGIAAGFTAAMLTALIVVVVAPFQPLPAERAAHIIFSLGVGVALLVYGLHEMRTDG
jgi:tetrahydromethanopterin S-methyltransferase subunit F